MSLLQHILERIRPVVGSKGWNYCVLWKLSEDQRFLELMDCCCAGTENNNNNNGGEELVFPVASIVPCRDVMFQHPRTEACYLLSQIPSSIPLLDSGIHAQTLIENQPRWLNFSDSSQPDLLQETVETRVLIPVPVGLIELFVDKQVSEDQQMVDYITSQFNISLEQQTMINSSTMDSSFSLKVDPIISENIDQKGQNEYFLQPPVSPATMLQSLNLQDDQIPLQNSPMNFFQQFNHTAENEIKNLLENANEPFTREITINSFKSSAGGYDQEEVDAFQKSMLINNNRLEHLASKKRQHNDRDSTTNRSDSVSDCSDQNDDEDNNDAKYRRKNGKEHQSKNLMAERNRRKKLNERLYNLRSLVPKITKLDKASILGDAIEYVMELQQQVRDLQKELERNIDEEDGPNDNHSTLQSEVLHGDEVKIGPKFEHGKLHSGTHMRGSLGFGSEVENTNNKVQQMEPQVEVNQLDGNEFLVKVFCEHKPGGFVKLMEALNSLSLKVTNVNVTSLLSLILNVLKVERKDNDMVQADHVRDSLLELTRNPHRSWPEMSKVASENVGSGSMDNYHHYHHHQHTVHLHSHQLKSQPNHHLHHLQN